MEHESFENEEVAKIMNEHFVNIKGTLEKNYGTLIICCSGSVLNLIIESSTDGALTVKKIRAWISYT